MSQFDNVHRSFLKTLLLVVGIIVFSSPLLAQNDNSSSEIPSSIKDLPNFTKPQNQWVIEWESIDRTNKLLWITQLKAEFERKVDVLPKEPAIDEWISLTRDLFNSLENILSYEESVEQSTFVEIQTLEEWLDKVDEARKLGNEVKRLQTELVQRTEEANQVVSQLSEELVNHRQFPEGSFEKLLSGMSIFAKQVKTVNLKERISLTKMRLDVTQNRQQTVQNSVNNAKETLSSTPEFDKTLLARQAQLETRLEQVKKLMASLQRRAWSSLKSEKEIVIQLSLQEEKLTELHLKGEILSIKVLHGISQLLQDEPTEFEQAWIIEADNLQREYDVTNDQLHAYSEQVIAAGEAANEMIFQRTQRSVWQYLESNRKLLTQINAELRDVRFFFEAYKDFTGLRKGWFSGIGLNWALWSSQAEVSWNSVWNYALFSVNEYPITVSDFINAIIIIIIGILFSSIIKRLLQRLGRNRSISESTIFTAARVIHYVVITTASLIALSTLGIDSSKIALVAGALSVGIGFGLQSIFNNFISGLILLFERPLKVGDLVELESGVRGRIKAINVRSTQLKTRDNIDILVPNSEFISRRVINYTFADPLRRLHIPFRTALQSDKLFVEKVAVESALSIEFTQKDRQHQPEIWLKRIGEYALEFELVVWVNANKLPDNDGIESRYLWQLETDLRDNGITIPIPHQKVFFDKNDWDKAAPTTEPKKQDE